MEVIHSYPSLPNGWRQELMMIVITNAPHEGASHFPRRFSFPF